MDSPTQSPPDWYSVLGVPPEASAEAIQDAYRAHMGQRFHSNSSRAANYQTQLDEAYRTLSDPLRRSRYDRQREQALITPAETRQHPIAKLISRVPWWGWMALWFLIAPRLLPILMATTVGQIILGMATVFVFWRLMPHKPAQE